MKQRDLDAISCNVYTFNIINNNNTRLVYVTRVHARTRARAHYVC